MRHDIDNAGFLKRRQTNGGAAIIREDQERPAIRNDAAMQRHAVHGSGHTEFTNAIIDIATRIIVFIQSIGRHSSGKV